MFIKSTILAAARRPSRSSYPPGRKRPAGDNARGPFFFWSARRLVVESSRRESGCSTRAGRFFS